MDIKIKTKSIFTFAKLIKKLNIASEIKEVFGKLKIEKDDSEEVISDKQSEFGLSLFMTLFNKIDEAEGEIYQFVAELTDKMVDDVKELEISEFIEIFVSIVKYPNFGSFFKQATTLTK